jgi:type IV pilus assembly protein PilF
MAKISYGARRYAAAKVFLERYRPVGRATPESLWLAAQTEMALGDRAMAATYVEKLHRDYPDSRQARTAGGVPVGH